MIRILPVRIPTEGLFGAETSSLRAGATGGVLGVQTPTASCFIILYNIISLHKWTPTFREIPLRTPTADKTWRRPCPY